MVGRPTRTIAGLARAAMSGTRLIREECAPLVFNSGLQHNAFLVPAGRHTPIGMRTDALGASVKIGDSSRNIIVALP